MSWNITCKQAVDYISKKEERRLSAKQRFQLWRHLLVCSLCRIFSRQNKTIAKAFQKQHEEEKVLSPEEKQKMIDAILPKD